MLGTRLPQILDSISYGSGINLIAEFDRVKLDVAFFNLAPQGAKLLAKKRGVELRQRYH